MDSPKRLFFELSFVRSNPRARQAVVLLPQHTKNRLNRRFFLCRGEESFPRLSSVATSSGWAPPRLPCGAWLRRSSPHESDAGHFLPRHITKLAERPPKRRTHRQFCNVPRRGLEPPYLAVLAPKASASTNFATSACSYYNTNFRLLHAMREFTSCRY